MTPKQATKAYQRGKLHEGALVRQPYGFLRGERHNGRVLSVDCNTDGEVCGMRVQWPDEDIPGYAHIEDLELPGETNKPSLRARIKTLLTRFHAQAQL